MMNLKILRAAVLGVVAIAEGLHGADSSPPPPDVRRIIRPPAVAEATPSLPAAARKDEPRFDLDFPGGKLPEFLQATADALKSVSKEPLNVVVPTEDADTKVPAFRLRRVSLRELFVALGAASKKEVVISTGGNSYQYKNAEWGFDETGPGSNVWVFRALRQPKFPELKAPPEPKSKPILSVYQLNYLLAKGLSVEDITTAIQVAWRVGGIEPPPELKYHAETGLLVMAGSPEAVKAIDNVLNALQVLPEKKALPAPAAK